MRLEEEKIPLLNTEHSRMKEVHVWNVIFFSAAWARNLVSLKMSHLDSEVQV